MACGCGGSARRRTQRTETKPTIESTPEAGAPADETSDEGPSPIEVSQAWRQVGGYTALPPAVGNPLRAAAS